MPSWRESYLTGVAIQDLFSYMWTDHRPYSPLLSPLARLKVFSPSSSSFSHPLLLTDVNEFQINVIYWSLCLACLTWFQSPLSPYLATFVPTSTWVQFHQRVGTWFFFNHSVPPGHPCLAPDPKWILNEASHFDHEAKFFIFSATSVFYYLCCPEP